MSEKVTVTKEVADAIEGYLTDCPSRRTDEEMRAILVAEHCGQDWLKYEIGQYAALNNITTFVLMSALVNGYEVEKSPEEKVREYYIENTDTVRYERWHANCAGSSIKKTLNLLGIKIEGVNA